MYDLSLICFVYILPGGTSKDHPVISGVPQGTVLGPLLFLIMIADIDKDVSSSKLVSFADDTRLYSGVGDVTDCDNLQFDLGTVYDWASSNNMFFNSKKFTYVPFSINGAAYKSNAYIVSYRIVSYKDKRQVMPVVVPSYTIT